MSARGDALQTGRSWVIRALSPRGRLVEESLPYPYGLARTLAPGWAWLFEAARVELEDLLSGEKVQVKL